MEKLSRREFLRETAVWTGALVCGVSLEGETAPARRLRSLVDWVPLGKTGIRVTYLGMGTGSIGWNHQSNQTRLGQERFTALVRHAYERGIRFFDAADMYGSHPYLKQALKGIPREKVVLQSKIISRTAEQAKKDLDRFRQELGTDYIDSVLIHVVTTPTWDEDFKGVRDVLSEAKERRVIKAHGVSCHGIGALRRAALSSWVQVDLARINPKGLHMDADPETVCQVLGQMKRGGKAVIGMKILGEGKISSPEEKEESLRFVLGLDCVDAIIIGFESPEQIDDILERGNRILAHRTSS